MEPSIHNTEADYENAKYAYGTTKSSELQSKRYFKKTSTAKENLCGVLNKGVL